MTILGLNIWTISGLLLILIGTYCIHRGSKSTLKSTISKAEESINKNTNNSVNQAKAEIKNPLNDLDDFMLRTYKPNFDDYISALNSHRVFLQALDELEQDKINGLKKGTIEKKAAKQAIQNKISEANNQVYYTRNKVNANIKTAELINQRVENQNIKQLWEEHKLYCEEGGNYYNGANGKEKSFEKSKEAIREAELRLVGIIYVTGIEKAK